MLIRIGSRRCPAIGSLLSSMILAACASHESSPEPTSTRLPPTTISSIVPYEDKDVGNEAVQTTCDWNVKLPKQIVEASEGLAVINDVNFSAPEGRKLRLLIVNVHAIGGAALTGPKWATVQGRLTDNGRIIGTFQLGRETSRGSFKACDTLRNLGEELSGDIADWLQHPTIDPDVKG